ncbi:MAG: bifunctional 5,10-methylenetetrahydrofolate dehydrogenase/5,10-methenyltetrahydrofolate cyclohydrolase [Candidatus Micrarchaeia archaeon]|jgi:methylenetetrahydrofolate dehydrogenase (NADP+)/methenyltetrahydrofolate cyclohydrolase
MILDGRKAAAEIRADVAAKLKQKKLKASLAVVLVGKNPSSVLYTNLKHKACQEACIESRNFELDENASEKELLSLIDLLNADEKFDGILVQLPLPKHINTAHVLAAIKPEKDVDGLNPVNLGGLLIKQELFIPCTPKGILRLLEKYKVDVKGKRCVIVGDSVEVGKPLAVCLLNRGATVFVCNEHTRNLASITREADILVSATGVPHLIEKDMVKPGAVVIDVGISQVGGKITGDVDFAEVEKVASAITPVPGGVGPMTIAMLLENTLLAAERRRKTF